MDRSPPIPPSDSSSAPSSNAPLVPPNPANAWPATPYSIAYLPPLANTIDPSTLRRRQGGTLQHLPCGILTGPEPPSILLLQRHVHDLITFLYANSDSDTALDWLLDLETPYTGPVPDPIESSSRDQRQDHTQSPSPPAPHNAECVCSYETASPSPNLTTIKQHAQCLVLLIRLLLGRRLWHVNGYSFFTSWVEKLQEPNVRTMVFDYAGLTDAELFRLRTPYEGLRNLLAPTLRFNRPPLFTRDDGEVEGGFSPLEHDDNDQEPVPQELTPQEPVPQVVLPDEVFNIEHYRDYAVPYLDRYAEKAGCAVIRRDVADGARESGLTDQGGVDPSVSAQIGHMSASLEILHERLKAEGRGGVMQAFDDAASYDAVHATFLGQFVAFTRAQMRRAADLEVEIANARDVLATDVTVPRQLDENDADFALGDRTVAQNNFVLAGITPELMRALHNQLDSRQEPDSQSVSTSTQQFPANNGRLAWIDVNSRLYRAPGSSTIIMYTARDLNQKAKETRELEERGSSPAVPIREEWKGEVSGISRQLEADLEKAKKESEEEWKKTRELLRLTEEERRRNARLSDQVEELGRENAELYRVNARLERDNAELERVGSIEKANRMMLWEQARARDLYEQVDAESWRNYGLERHIDELQGWGDELEEETHRLKKHGEHWKERLQEQREIRDQSDQWKENYEKRKKTWRVAGFDKKRNQVEFRTAAHKTDYHKLLPKKIPESHERVRMHWDFDRQVPIGVARGFKAKPGDPSAQEARTWGIHISPISQLPEVFEIPDPGEPDPPYVELEPALRNRVSILPGADDGSYFLGIRVPVKAWCDKTSLEDLERPYRENDIYPGDWYEPEASSANQGGPAGSAGDPRPSNQAALDQEGVQHGPEDEERAVTYYETTSKTKVPGTKKAAQKCQLKIKQATTVPAAPDPQGTEPDEENKRGEPEASGAAPGPSNSAAEDEVEIKIKLENEEPKNPTPEDQPRVKGRKKKAAAEKTTKPAAAKRTATRKAAAKAIPIVIEDTECEEEDAAPDDDALDDDALDDDALDDDAPDDDAPDDHTPDDHPPSKPKGEGNKQATTKKSTSKKKTAKSATTASTVPRETETHEDDGAPEEVPPPKSKRGGKAVTKKATTKKIGGKGKRRAVEEIQPDKEAEAVPQAFGSNSQGDQEAEAGPSQRPTRGRKRKQTDADNDVPDEAPTTKRKAPARGGAKKAATKKAPVKATKGKGKQKQTEEEPEEAEPESPGSKYGDEPKDREGDDNYKPEKGKKRKGPDDDAGGPSQRATKRVTRSQAKYKG